MDRVNMYRESCHHLSPSTKAIHELYRIKEEKYMKNKRIGAVIVAFCLLLCSVCFAVGTITNWASSVGEKRTTSYSEGVKQLEAIGLNANFPESFTNGYAFSEFSEGVSSGLDETGNTLLEVNIANVKYEREGNAPIMLDISPENCSEQVGNIIATRELDGRHVNICEYTYKCVPTDYQVTEEDKVLMQQSDFMLAYGSDEVQVQSLQICSWTDEGIAYSLIGFDTLLNEDELFSMANDICYQIK